MEPELTYDDLLVPKGILPTQMVGGERTITDAQLIQAETEKNKEAMVKWGTSLADTVVTDPEKGLLDGDVINAATRLASTGIAAYVVAQESRFEPDPNDVFPATGSEEWKELTEGLPPELWPNLARGVSKEHRQFIRESTLQELAAGRDIAEAGIAGMTALVARSIVDEGNIALTALTGGLAAPFIFGAKVTRLQRIARLGTLSAAENTILDGILLAGQNTKDPSDLFYSALAGFGMGGLVGRFAKGEQIELGRAIDEVAKANDLKILNDAGITSMGRPKETQIVSTARAAIGERQALEADETEVKFTAKEIVISPAELDDLMSVGAAQVIPATIPYPLRDQIDSPEILQTPRLGKQELKTLAARIGQKAESALRIDFAASFARSENPYERYLGGGLVADPVGYRGRTNEHSVEEIAGGLRAAAQTAFYRQTDDALPEWLAVNKVPFGKRTEETAKFMNAVTDAVESQDFSNPQIAKAAKGMMESIRIIFEPAQRHGVKGFPDLVSRPDYVPHIPSHEKIPMLNTKYGDEQMRSVIAEAIRKGTGLTPEKAAVIAKGYWGRLRDLAAGIETSPHFAFRDEEYLRDAMKQAGVDDIQIDDALGAIDFGKDITKAGKLPRAKRRLDLDMDTVVGLKNRETGNIDQVSIKAIFERDARLLVHNYSRQIAGHIGMAKRFGITSRGEWETALKKMKVYASNLSTDYDLNQGLKRLESAYKSVTGQPMEDWTNWHRALKVTRDVNFMSDLGQAGFSQFGDLGNLLTLGGGRILYDQMPELKAMATRLKTGELADEAMDELEAFTGLGTDMLRHQAPSRFDLGYTDELEPMLKGQLGTQVDIGIHASRNFVATWSGLAPLTVIEQRAAAKAMQQQFVNTAFKTDGKTLTLSNLRSAGIKDDMAERIYAELRANTEFKTSNAGRQVRRTNLEQWTDLDARDAYLLAIRRESRRWILEGDLGSAPLFMSKEAGKSLIQFRGFSIHAYSKLLIHGVKIDGMRAFAPWVTSVAFSSIAYMIKQHTNSIGLSNRDEYLEKALQPDKILKAAFQNAAYSSLIPMGVDTIWQLVGQDAPFKESRYSGLESGFSWNSNPTTSTLYNLARTPGMFADGTVTKSEFKGMVSPYPLQNMIGIKNVFDAIAEDLPTKAPSEYQ